MENEGNAAHEYTERKVNNLFKSKQSQWYREIKNIVEKKGVDFNLDEKEFETANKTNSYLVNIV